ncbi:MAG: hypothetical protein C4519_22200 [Desulfobacteraceae bacterium]|nr:MAG: hypothetical protein C4519_22200 [Desulfobacteraceae bacterium]
MDDRIGPIEDLIPHRQNMRLIDTILSIDQDHAVTQATVKENWPLTTHDGASPLLLIELAAQTAGVCFGWNELQKPAAQRDAAKGWIVGIKKAQFFINRIAPAACITTRTENFLLVQQYKEIIATASLGETRIAVIHLQVLQADRSAFQMS